MPYTITEKDVKIYYNILNAKSRKTPIVFVHGFIVNWSCFKSEINYFKKLNYPILYFDLRGHGKSSVPSDEKKFSINSLVDDLDVLVSKACFKKIFLVGHSLGGIVSLMYTIRRKSKVEKLVVLNSSYKAPDKSIIAKGFINHHHLKFIYQKMLKNKNSKKIIEFDDSKMETRTSKYLFFLKCLLNSDLKTIFLFADELFNLKIKTLSEIKCPTLIIESLNDEFFSNKEGMSLKRHIKHSTIKFFPGGHDIIMRKPILISKEIEQFFATNRM